MIVTILGLLIAIPAAVVTLIITIIIELYKQSL